MVAIPLNLKAIAVRLPPIAAKAIEPVFILAYVSMAAFFATIAFGYVRGDALPNTTFLRLFPRAEMLAMVEPYLGLFLLMLALLGAACSWIASLDAPSQEMFSGLEARLVLGFRRFGLVAIIGALLFSLGTTWAGISRSQDLSSSAIAGLVPFSDAYAHFQSANIEAIHGGWGSFAERRPLAAAVRMVFVVAAGFNNYRFLALQTIALAIASFYAVSAVTSWRGLWAGMTFFGLTFIVMRPYLATNLTEPLSILFAIASIPFLVRALRTGNLAQGGIALHLLCWTQLIRMASMFTIPAFGLWLILTPSSLQRRLMAGCVVGGVLLVNFGVSGALSKFYGIERGQVGSNFSYVICGLTHGTDWTGCPKLYAEDLKAAKDEAEVPQLLYARAFEKFTSDPSIFFRRFVEGERYFLSNFWNVTLVGYTGKLPHGFPKVLWIVVSMVGIVWVMITRRERCELSFWLLMLGSIDLSAPFIIFDDGWRTICTSFVLVALLVASGFASPTAANSFEKNLFTGPSTRIGLGLAISSIVLCLIVPGLAHKMDLLGSKAYEGREVADDEDVFLGAGHMSGFLVLPDNAPLVTVVPSISYSSFTAIIRNSAIEQYEPLVVAPPAITPPFAMLAAIPLNKERSALLIAPTEVMTRSDVPAWKLRFTTGPMWERVVEATPIVR